MRRFGVCATALVYLLTFVVPGLGPGLVRSALGQEAPAPAEVARILGVPALDGKDAVQASQRAARALAGITGGPKAGGLVTNMAANAPFSAAIITSLSSPLFETTLLGDWDGKEDLVADHSGSAFQISGPAVLTRAAISEHTRANGFNENIFYVGDSVGNVYVVASNPGDSLVIPHPPANVTVLNLPTLLNAFGTLNSDSHIVITGICVNPVSDLTAFPNVNGSFAPFAGQTGEVLIVTFWDAGGGLRGTGGTGNVLIRSGMLGFPIADVPSPAAAPPGVQSALGFPVTVGGAFGEAFSVFANLAGCAIDDDGSIYFQNVDLENFTGANIAKITRTGANQDRSPATNAFGPPITTLNPPNGLYGRGSGPVGQVNTYTNYSGTSPTFGNIVALAAGAGNTLYAAVARSRVATDDPATQATEGLFANPAALGPTPSMIISFSDSRTVPGTNQAGNPVPGVFVPSGFAEVATQGLTLVPGVNNFRAFALGQGPDPRGTLQPVFGLASVETLKLDFQVDYTIYSGLTVDEENKVYVVSGGTPAGVGLDPSPALGEILVFTDQARANRRTDFVDLRTAGTLPNPPSAGTNQGDGVSDRFDHIFWQAPLDPVTVTPTGVAGLARGFLVYLNRTRATAQFPHLPNPGPQGHNVASGPNPFNDFDPSHQVAGGDISLSGPATLIDYEFLFGGISGGSCVASWTDFFLNSNGNVTFGIGDTIPAAAAAAFLTGPPRIAPAWTDLNPGSRAGFPNTFPLQAMGFAGINDFKIRWINVPETGQEAAGSSNTFAVSLFDDGTGTYTPSPTHQKGPTASRFEIQSDGTLVSLPPRAAGTAPFAFQYGRMDLQGSGGNPVLAGYSIGGQSAAAAGPTNLGEGSRAAALGTGNEVAVFEVFSSGNLDLRFEGNDAGIATPSTQPDLDRDYLTFVGKTCAAPPAAVLPTLTLSLAQSNLHPGQSLTLNATLTPGPVAAPVNIFVLVQLPTGEIFSFTLGGFVPGIAPVVTGFTPVPFSGTVFSLPLPGGLPLGTYTWFSALTGSGAPFIVGDTLNIGQVPFNFQP